MECWCTCNMGLRVISKVVSLLSLVGGALGVVGDRRTWSHKLQPRGPVFSRGKEACPPVIGGWCLIVRTNCCCLLCGVTSSELGFSRLDSSECGFGAGGRPQTTVKCKLEISDSNHFSLSSKKKKKQKFNPRVTKWHHFDLCQFTVLSRDPQQEAQ